MERKEKSSSYDILVKKDLKNKNRVKKYFLTSFDIKIIFILSCLLISYIGYSIYFSYTYEYINYIRIWFYICFPISFIISSLTIFSLYNYEYKDKLIIDETYTYKKSKFFEYIAFIELSLSVLYLFNVIIYVIVIANNIRTFNNKTKFAYYGMFSFMALIVSSVITNIYLNKIRKK